MLIRDLKDMHYITAGDETTLCEWLHPERDAALPALGYSLAHAMLPAGTASRPHRLMTSTEVYVILSGRGEMHLDGECAEIGPGQAVVIPAGSTQWVRVVGEEPLVFLALVSPPWRAEDEEVTG